MANKLVRFSTVDGPPVFVEIDDRSPGYRPVGRTDMFGEAKKTFDEALHEVNSIATKALDQLRNGVLKPDTIEIEFGVQFNAEVGAVIAKASGESHFNIKLTWAPSEPAAADSKQ